MKLQIKLIIKSLLASKIEIATSQILKPTKYYNCYVKTKNKSDKHINLFL